MAKEWTKRIVQALGAGLGLAFITPVISGFATIISNPIFGGLSIASLAGATLGLWGADVVIQKWM